MAIHDTPQASGNRSSLRQQWQLHMQRGEECLQAGLQEPAHRHFWQAMSIADGMLRQPEWVAGQQRRQEPDHVERYLQAGLKVVECLDREGSQRRGNVLLTRITQKLRYRYQQQSAPLRQRLVPGLRYCLHLLSQRTPHSLKDRLEVQALQGVLDPQQSAS